MALSVGASRKERPRSFFAAVVTPGATGYRQVTVVAIAWDTITTMLKSRIGRAVAASSRHRSPNLSRRCIELLRVDWPTLNMT